ncbi:GlsB/YeaQ/YmgE family stress response membrane protein [Dactylosporangium siamense]|uniref:GlsB/YeaQ/YmgE family stress response membrane protein n=1 Tax=Dactylosporangium siamense TaxID=685454 RepID=UPI001EF1E22F|nr:hypothetical protein [Dactylosporangium siamense]
MLKATAHTRHSTMTRRVRPALKSADRDGLRPKLRLCAFTLISVQRTIANGQRTGHLLDEGDITAIDFTCRFRPSVQPQKPNIFRSVSRCTIATGQVATRATGPERRASASSKHVFRRLRTSRTMQPEPTVERTFTVGVQDYLPAIVFGAVIGIVARILLPGRQPIGLILTILIGMGAAVAGTWAADRWDLHSDKSVTVAGHTYDWLVLGVQVGIAVVGVGVAALLARAFSNDDD